MALLDKSQKILAEVTVAILLVHLLQYNYDVMELHCTCGNRDKVALIGQTNRQNRHVSLRDPSFFLIFDGIILFFWEYALHGR